MSGNSSACAEHIPPHKRAHKNFQAPSQSQSIESEEKKVVTPLDHFVGYKNPQSISACSENFHSEGFEATMSAFSTYISGSQRGLEKSIHAVREPVVDGPKIPSWEAPTYLLKEALTPQPTTEKQNLPDKKVLSDSKRFFEAAKILFLPGGTHDKDGEAGNGKFDANKYGKPGES